MKKPTSIKPSPKEIVQYHDVRCPCCGKQYDVQKGNFYTSRSPLNKGNNGFMAICKNCVDGLYDYYYKKYENVKLAVKDVCRKLDIYYSSKFLETYISGEQKVSPVGYMCTMNSLVGNREKNYDNTLNESELMTASDGISQDAESEQRKEAMNMFGAGYDPGEYDMLFEHYQNLKRQFDSVDAAQEVLIKDLCTIHIMKQRSVRAKDFDGVDKAMKLYQATLKNSGLSQKKNDVDESEDNKCWGNFINMIEHHAPAEIYKDKRLFDDYDDVKGYFKRFILRPMINFFSGGTQMDEEYSVEVGEKDEELNE